MPKQKFHPLLLLLFLFPFKNSLGQILCVKAYQQDDSISHGVNNLLFNGSFENNDCHPGPCQFCGNGTSFCPNSSTNQCDITNWTCSGGGGYTFSNVIDHTFSNGKVVDGNVSAQFQNGFCEVCSQAANDISCLFDSAHVVYGIPNGFPSNEPIWGGTTGNSLQQTVTGLVPGNTYVLEFWAGGDQPSYYFREGVFAVDVGFGNVMLRNKPTTPSDIGTRYLIEFNAASTSHTIKFTSWGHTTYNSAEVTLDDVRLYTLAELSPFVSPCAYLFAAQANATVTTCGQCNGSATAIPIQGTAPFSFLWSNSSTAQSLSGLCAGTYRVTITDANNVSDFVITTVASSPYMSPPFIQASETEICASDTTEICVVGNYQTYMWNTGVSSNCIRASLAGNYYLTASNNSGCSLESNHISIAVHPLPAVGVSVNGDTLTSYNGNAYQWYRNGVAINGAIDEMYIVVEGGNYSVQITDSNGCTAFSSSVVFSGIKILQPQSIAVYPNPATDQVNITVDESLINAQLNIYNATGALMHTTKLETSNLKLETVNYPTGVYIAEIKTKELSVKRRWIKM